MTVYNLKLTTLAPLHISDGIELRQDFDFVVHHDRTYRLDENAILEKYESEIQHRAPKYPLPGTLLQDTDFANPALFRYQMIGTPRSVRADARLRSQIKDAFDRAYIPGSSLKGALRTALAWTGWDEIRPRLDRSAIGRNRSWAGQPLEHSLFGPDPNHDLLRALHVGDLNGPTRPGESMIVVNAQVVTIRSTGSPVELEAIRPDVVFTGALTVDDALFSGFAENVLHFSKHKHWLEEIMARAQKHSLARLQRLAEWHERAEQNEAVAGFYRKMLAAEMGPNAAFIQLGWGGGWDSKTFGSHLQKDTTLFDSLLSDFKMQHRSRNAPPRKPGDAFPASRRVAVSVKLGGRPARPLGWVLVELEKIDPHA